MTNQKNFDIILWGATGFTGQLVAEYLLRQYGINKDIKWAMAGRSQEKLQEVQAQLGEQAAKVPLLIADSKDRLSLDALVSQTRVLLTTVGPYALYGSELVAACIASGTDYCDLTGEVPWMRSMLDQHSSEASSSDARIVHCCGFDSIPSDMGVWYLQQAAMQKFGQPLQQIKLRVKAAKGGLSGGTYASMMHIGEQAKKDSSVASILKNPYSICPPEGRKGPRQPYVAGPHFDKDFKAWTAPFVMAAINTRIVNRSNALMGYPYSDGFIYDEATLMGKGGSGRLRAIATSLGMGAFFGGFRICSHQGLTEKVCITSTGRRAKQRTTRIGFLQIITVG